MVVATLEAVVFKGTPVAMSPVMELPAETEKSINSFAQILFLICSGTLDARGTALEIKEFLLLSTVGSDVCSIPLVNVWMLLQTASLTLG